MDMIGASTFAREGFFHDFIKVLVLYLDNIERTCLSIGKEDIKRVRILDEHCQI